MATFLAWAWLCLLGLLLSFLFDEGHRIERTATSGMETVILLGVLISNITAILIFLASR